MIKKVTALVLIFLVFACKDEKREQEVKTGIDEKVNVPKSIVLPNYPLWKTKNITLKDNGNNFDIYDVFDVKRGTAKETSYLMIDNFSVSKGSLCKAAVIAKKGSSNSLFGLRIMGAYPNRIDALFNLEEGLEKETKITGGFSNGSSKIEHIEDGWYKCTIEAIVNTSDVKIIIGPTSNDSKTITWEADTNNQEHIQILPSSLIFEELAN